jgi:DNA-binding winged helix-turn-helix (wHTH) protein
LATAYRFGRVQVRPAERQVLVDGEAVGLVGRAYDLLLALIDRRDRVVTKGELLDLVWPGVVVEEHNLHTQVSAVRRIIGRGAIATIAGRGYRFVAPADLVLSEATNSIESLSASLPSPPAAGGLRDSSLRKPSIAVLPFTNMSGDAEQEYFSDGITEDIITDLSKVSGLMVVARNTSFAEKYKGADIRTVGRELGVDRCSKGRFAAPVTVCG